MSSDNVTEHPNLGLRRDLESLRNDLKALQILYSQTSQALLILHEENKLIKDKLRKIEENSK